MKRPNNINDAQWQAVINPSDYLLITAGPGTGKTHTLTYRIIYFLSKLQDNQKILAITFTNKAAQEMGQRLKLYLGKESEAVTVGTFHKFCLSCLREFADLTGLPKNFQIASEAQRESLARQVWQDKPKQIRDRLKAISRQKNIALAEPTQDLLLFNQKLRENNFLDFDDILQEAFKLLQDNAHVQKEIHKRYPYIFVDEYQDINEIQHEILKLLAPKNVGFTPLENAADNAVGKTPSRFGNDALPSSIRETKNNSLTGLTAIGDPHQAIYGFRGSDVHFFHDFLKDFPSGQTLSLHENYRSSENLLEAAGQVIAKEGSFTFSPLTARIYKEGRLVIYQAPTERAEAEYIVHQIEKWVGGTSMFSKDSKRVDGQAEGHLTFGDIAILYRVNAERKAIEEALHRSGIPFKVSGEKFLCEEKDVVRVLPHLLLMKDKPIEEVVNYLSQSCKEHNSDALERLLSLAQQSKSALDFLDNLFLQRENEYYAYAVEKVSLLTLHAAKGLEFAAVFIAGCEDGFVPLKRDDKKTDLEEERRLFYVGMTRAKTFLFLTWAGRRTLYGKTFTPVLSPFVLDIEEQLKQYERSSAQGRKKKNAQMDFLKKF